MSIDLLEGCSGEPGAGGDRAGQIISGVPSSRHSLGLTAIKQLRKSGRSLSKHDQRLPLGDGLRQR